MLKKLSIFVVIAMFLTAASLNAKSTDKVGGEEWKVRMHSLLSDVLELIPFAFDDAKYSDPAHAEKIQASLKSLAANSAGLKKHMSHFKPNEKTDPSFKFIAESFESEAVFAESTFSQAAGSKDQSQKYLRLALSKCVMCHTQSANGPELKLNQFKSQFAKLSTSDRLIALTATRQFDAALEEFGSYVRSAKVTKPEAAQFDRNVRAMLSISIRVKKDPAQAKALLDGISESGAGSSALQAEVQSWKKAVVAWQSEAKPALATEQELFNEAKRLVNLGQDKGEMASSDRSQINLLRASTHLHDLLLKYPSSSLRGESFLMLASIYESLPGFAIWDLGDEYLGSCIQENPHSEIAEKCFKQYKDSIMFGYTGSSGTHIPGAIQKHVEQMKKLAQRTDKPSPSDKTDKKKKNKKSKK